MSAATHSDAASREPRELARHHAFGRVELREARVAVRAAATRRILEPEAVLVAGCERSPRPLDLDRLVSTAALTLPEDPAAMGEAIIGITIEDLLKREATL